MRTFTYENDFKDFVDEKASGRTFQIDEEMFYYWLETLPPIYMSKEQEIDGKKVNCSFGFAEGTEFITDFWREKGNFYGKTSNRLNHY